MAFDGDASLSFKVHVVKHLPFGDLYGIGEFKQPVGQSWLTMVDVGYDAKVAYILHIMLVDKL